MVEAGHLSKGMRFVTYNVNSLNARLPRLLALIDEHQPDILCVQETKTAPDKFPHLELQAAGYVAADNSGGRWAGVAVLARTELGIDEVVTGLPDQPNPQEARWVEATIDGIRVVSVYVPNGRQVGSETFFEKLEFFDRMADRAEKIARGPVFMAGDMNVCPTDLDVWNPDEIHGATHITEEERSRYRTILEHGYVDAFRELQPDETGFTWWDYRAGHFHKGYGLRIDLALVSNHLASGLSRAWVDRSYRKPTKVRESKASDHAPLIVDIAD